MDKNEIITFLELLDLNEREITIYLALLESGQCSITKLSELAKLPRTTAHNDIEILIKKGFIEEMSTQRERVVIAQDPEFLQSKFNEKTEKYLSYSNKVSSNIDYLKQLQSNVSADHIVLYYRGKTGLKQLLWNSLKADGITYGYSAMGRGQYFGEKFQNDMATEYVKRNIKDQVIVPDNEKTNAYFKDMPKVNKNYEVRLLPENQLSLTSDIIIYNNVYAVASWQSGNPFGFEIHSKDFANTQLSIFKTMWEIAEPIN